MPDSDGKRVLVVCQLDRFANGQKPLQIQRFLQQRGHEVRLFDTYYLSRTSSRAGMALYALHATYGLLARVSGRVRRYLSYHLYRLDWSLRRAIFSDSLELDDFDLVICETPYDAAVLSVPTTARTFYDCPTPWADELYLEGRLTRRQHRKFRQLEKELFESVDHLSFHWQTYADYAVRHYKISGRNLVTLNWGCVPAARRAEFSANPRIVYLGSLNVHYIDLPLLARLTKLYPDIDVYGGPPPDPALGLNYLGYSAPSVLEQYQMGLITCTSDELRRDGFSAKHLDYLAHGLPTLVPAWRRHLDLLEGSVPYTEETFLSQVAMVSQEQEWRRVSDEANQQAVRLSWDETLRPLESVLG